MKTWLLDFAKQMAKSCTPISGFCAIILGFIGLEDSSGISMPLWLCGVAISAGSVAMIGYYIEKFYKEVYPFRKWLKGRVRTKLSLPEYIKMIEEGE